MLKKAMITVALGAAVVGGGTAALAASGHTASVPTSSSATPPTPAASSASTKKDKHAAKHKGNRTNLGRALHATWVTKNNKTNAVVTHDAIRGTVSAVSSTSVTVKAADGVSQTYKVDSSTKVLKRAATSTPTKGHKAAASSIAQVKVGDKAAVVGTGTTSLTATHIVDGLKK